MCLAGFVVVSASLRPFLSHSPPPPLSFSSSARPLLFHRLSHSGHARHSITLFHRPRYSSRHSTRLGTYVWLREMLLCISSRMFDGALLFKHGPRHYRWTDMSSDLHTYGDDVHQTHHHLSNNPFVCSNWIRTAEWNDFLGNSIERNVEIGC